MKRVRFDGMSWPLPDPDLGWRARYATEFTESDRLAAAEIMGAYLAIIAHPARTRARVVREIRAAQRKRGES